MRTRVAMMPRDPERDDSLYIVDPEDSRRQPLNLIGVFAHHPDLAHSFFTFNRHIVTTNSLAERQRELLALRTATLRSCTYEWTQHVFMARNAGISDEEISRIAFGPDAPFWTDLEAALLRATDELIIDGVISDSTWITLSEGLDNQQILDVIFTVAAYDALSWMLRSVGLRLPDDFYDVRGQ